VIGAILLGAAFGGALCLLVWALLPARVDNVAVLGRIAAARAPQPYPTASPTTQSSGLVVLRRRLGDRLCAHLTRRGVQAASLRQDLALLDRTMEDFLGGVVLLTAGGLFGGLLLGTSLRGLGWGIPSIALLPLAAVLAIVLMCARYQDVRREAGRRRREFRRALSAYLDLVAMAVLAGTGLPEALPAAAAIGQGWAFRLLADTYEASGDRDGPLAAPAELAALGHRIGVIELRELSTALTLTGEQGARIGKTLIDRAKTLRERDTADVQGRAAERDVSLQVAQVGIGAGFLLFVIYPLVVSIVHH
jgi:tight adherence protein C